PPSSGVHVTNNMDQCPDVDGEGSIDGCPYAPTTLSNGLSNDNYVYVQTPKIASSTTSVSSLSRNDVIENITYFDGIGRPRQSIAIKAGGNNEDIVTQAVYDALGRQTREYLPFAATSQNGQYHVSPL